MSKMKKTISTILSVTFLSGLCAATIFGQNSQNPAVDKSKLAVNQISDDEKPLRSFKIKSQKQDIKPIDVKIFAGSVKALEVTGTLWDDAKKVLIVEIENKNTAAASSKALLNLSSGGDSAEDYLANQTAEPTASYKR